MVNSSINLKEQLALRVNRELSNQLDSVIEKMTVVARKFSIEQDDANSPFKNVLNVSVEPSSSLEVIKNFVRYQTGRKGASKIWKKPGFADAVVRDLDSLIKEAKQILERVEEPHKLKENGQKDIDVEGSTETHPIVLYISENRYSIERSLHLQLAQLYLGYLSREHIASKGGSPGQVKENSSVASSESRPTYKPVPKLTKKA